MKETEKLSQMLRRVSVPASSKLDERIHREIDNAVTPAVAEPCGSEPTFGQIFALIMKRKSTRYTLVTTAGLTILAALVLTHPAPSAWAMDQAIETLKKYKGLEFSGNVSADGKTFPIDGWQEADGSGDFVQAELIKVGDTATVWTSDNKTYDYEQEDKTVYVEPGVTQGLNPWPGPKFLSLMATVKDYQAIEGYDPATGRKREVVACSTDGIGGPQSFLLEFDFGTKLLVSMKVWNNSRQEGPPHLDFEKIRYFEDLPESTFNFQPPAGTPVTNMPLTIPDAEASRPALSDTNYGISAEGMTREEACHKILEQYWAADIKYDFARIRQLCPVAADYSDELLRKSGEMNGIVQLLKIGGIERTGSSKLGPLALVPSWVRDTDGVVSEIWMIVQFRESEQGASCVVYGPRGYAINVKE